MRSELKLKFLEETNTRRKFVFLNALRVAVLSVFLIVLVFLSILLEKAPFSFVIPFTAVGIAIGLAVLGFKFYDWFNFELVIYIQSFADIAIISLLVYYSGGISSPFYFLYIFPIIISAMFLNRRDTLYIATFSYIVFGVISDLVYLEILPYYPLMSEVTITLNLFVYNLVMSFIAFSSIAILSSFYFDRIRKTGAELRNARENLKDLILLNNTVLERMENGFIITDATGVIVSFNEKSKAMLNFSSISNIFDLLSIDTHDSGNTAGDPPFNKRYYFEHEVNGLVLGVSYSVIENIYSFDKVFVFVITDLTEKREFEKRLKQKEKFALIGEMSAGIAHEIRNPLASISGSVQFLQKELKLDPEYQNLMDIIVKESSRLSSSIEVFLDYAKTTPLQRTEFDLAGVIDDVTELVCLNHPEINLVKKFEKGYTINADMKKINQVVWNLVNNAVKALEDNGTVEVNIYRKEDLIFLSIEDNGIGIDSSEMSRIFTPFYSRFTSGIGLGMAIVKRIIDEHHFDISIKSEKNIGTEVTICFRNV